MAKQLPSFWFKIKIIVIGSWHTNSEMAVELLEKYRGIIKAITLSSPEDLKIIEDIQECLEFFKDNQTSDESSFLQAFKEFLTCSIITYNDAKIANHQDRRQWLENLPPKEKDFFEQNRLRINKIFPLLFALDELILNDTETVDDKKIIFEKQDADCLNNLHLKCNREKYDKLDIESKIKLINEIKIFCLQVFTKIKITIKLINKNVFD